MYTEWKKNSGNKYVLSDVQWVMALDSPIPSIYCKHDTLDKDKIVSFFPIQDSDIYVTLWSTKAKVLDRRYLCLLFYAEKRDCIWKRELRNIQSLESRKKEEK